MTVHPGPIPMDSTLHPVLAGYTLLSGFVGTVPAFLVSRLGANKEDLPMSGIPGSDQGAA